MIYNVNIDQNSNFWKYEINGSKFWRKFDIKYSNYFVCSVFNLIVRELKFLFK